VITPVLVVVERDIKESTLSSVPNATKLAGLPASDYATTAAATATGVVPIPTGGASHVLFTRYPLTWIGTCTVSGSSDAFTLSVKSAESVDFTEGAASLGSTIAKGATLEIDDGNGNGTPVQTVAAYAVTGADGAQYMGEFTGQFKQTNLPCATAITAMGN
jgi:hypothetical protein